MSIVLRRIAAALVALGPALAAPSLAHAQTLERVAAVVNDDAVTLSALGARMQMAIASSGLPNDDETRRRLGPQILRQLIDERLKIQEAKRLGFEATDEDLERALQDIAKQNGVPPQELRAVLARMGIPFGTLVDKMRADIAWSKLVRAQLRPQVAVGEEEVDEVLARLETAVGQPEYLVAEIFVGVDRPEDDAQARELANRLAAEMTSGRASFSAVARQFSQSASAASGGDLGWVRASDLPEELGAAIQAMQPGQATTPLRGVDGYYLLLLRDRRQIAAGTLPSREQIMNALGDERLNLLQRRLLRDLRSDAYVDVRL